MNRLESLLHKKPFVLGDGATGTMLQRAARAAGLPPGFPVERLNLERPDLVLELHKRYVAAGAELLLTNTFGATRHRMRKHGAEENLPALLRAASAIARDAAGDEVVVLADVGPLGALLAPLGPLDPQTARELVAEQVAAMASTSMIDGIWIETMSDLREVEAAVHGARDACSLPIFVSMSFDTRGRTMMGVSAEQAAVALSSYALAGYGANCGRTVADTLQAVVELRANDPSAVLIAKPNAGVPRLHQGQEEYDIAPEEFGSIALQFLQAGATIFGGCCGTTPAHIAAARAEIDRAVQASRARQDGQEGPATQQSPRSKA